MHKILSSLFSILFGLIAMYGMAQNPDPTIYMRYGEGRSNTLIVTNGNAFARSSITGVVYSISHEVDELRTITTNTFAILVPLTNDLYVLRFLVDVVTNQIEDITNRLEDMPYLTTNNLYDTTVPMPSISWSDTSGDLNFKNAPLNISSESTSLRTYIDYTGLYFYGESLPTLGLYMGGSTPGVLDSLYLNATSVEAERLHIYAWLETGAQLGDYDTYGFLLYDPYLSSYYDTYRGEQLDINSGYSSGIDLDNFKVAALGEVRSAITQLRTELPTEFVPAYYYNDQTYESYNLYLGYSGFEINAPVLNTGAYSTHLISNTVYLDDIPPYSLASIVLARDNDSPAYNIFIEKNLDGTFDIIEDTNSWEP